jgi:hypothetical protein
MKTILSLTILTLFCNFLLAQTTAIPDVHFEQSLINQGLDTGTPNGSVPTANIDTVTSLHEGNPRITSLVGIEDFAALTSLTCGNLPLKSLDVSQNKALTYLKCNNSQLTSLDVSQNTALATLHCYGNELTELNVSQNVALTDLACFSNKITMLNLSNNPALTSLACSGDQLECLNIKNGNNTKMGNIQMDGSPKLTCIEVDDVAYSTANWLSVDAWASYSTSCPNQCTVGIDPFESTVNYSFYPNPTKGIIHIELIEENKTGISTTLRNHLGQIVSIQKFESTDNIVLNLNTPSGIYFLTIETVSGKQKTIKVIKE